MIDLGIKSASEGTFWLLGDYRNDSVSWYRVEGYAGGSEEENLILITGTGESKFEAQIYSEPGQEESLPEQRVVRLAAYGVSYDFVVSIFF